MDIHLRLECDSNKVAIIPRQEISFDGERKGHAPSIRIYRQSLLRNERHPSEFNHTTASAISSGSPSQLWGSGD